MKKIISILILLIIIVGAILYFVRDFIIKEYLERKMSSVNHAPVTIGSLNLDYFEKYITLKDVKIMSNLNKEQIFISIDELKSYYEIDYNKKIVNFEDAEINGIALFKDVEYDYNEEEGVSTFENRVTEVEEKQKRDKVLEELKNLYMNKVEEHHLNVEEVLKKNFKTRDFSEIDKVKESIKNIKESSKKKLSISEVIDEISSIGKNVKKIVKNTDLKDFSSTISENGNENSENSADGTIRNFLNRNKLVLFDLDGYINMYLNLVYEEKIYDLSLKYKDLLDEIRLRKAEDEKLADEDKWELFFDSISISSEFYGINFNGEVKNFSTRLSKNKENTVFKLYGEKGDTIGEFKGFLNFDKENSQFTLNIPEANLKDLGNDLIEDGQAMLYQELNTDKYYLAVNGSIHLKDMKLDIEKVIEKMKIQDRLAKEILAPILREITQGTIYYSYDTDNRVLNIRTDLLEIFDGILNKDKDIFKEDSAEKIAG